MIRHDTIIGDTKNEASEAFSSLAFTSGKRFAFCAVVFIIAYFLFEAIFITFISHGAGLDDAEQLANISFFDWGYGGSQPPVYTWLLIVITSLFGTSFFVLQLVKFSLLASLFLSIYFGLRQLKVAHLVAASAMLATFMLPQIAWESQRALSHSILGTASCGWVFWAMSRYFNSQKILNAILLGVCIAICVLGKFNDVIFIIAIFIAGLSFSNARRSLLQVKSLLIFGVAALLLFKPLSWILTNIHATVERSHKFALGQEGNFFLDRLAGISSFSLAIFNFIALAFVIAGAIVIINRAFRRTDSLTENEQFAFEFVGRILFIGLVIVAIMILLSGATNIKDRWLQPVLILAPAFFALFLYRFIDRRRVLMAYGLCGAVFAVMVPIGLFYNLNIGAAKDLPLGFLKFDQLYESVSKEGPIATIYSPDAKISGNLRLFDTNIKTIHNETVNGFTRLKRPILLLWEDGQNFQMPISAILTKLGELQTYDIKTIELGYKGRMDPKKTIHYIYIP